MLLRKLLKTKRNQFLVKLNRNQIKSREDFQSLVFALKLASFPCQNKKPKETKGGIDQWKRQQKLEISFPPFTNWLCFQCQKGSLWELQQLNEPSI